MNCVLSVENVAKSYRLGTLGSATLREDVARWLARLRNRPDPYLRIGEEHRGRFEKDRVWALRGASFQARPGEVLGIVGRNGAGKSTLLKILSRVTAPTSGEVKIRGRLASLLEVGTGFHPELTGRENIFLNGAILGMSRAEIRGKFDEIVAFAELDPFIDTPVKRYSSGMYVRLAFAVAAHLEPEILVIDEVLAVGDAAFQKKCLGKMHDVAGHGRTILFVSHNMAAVQSLCTRAVLLVDGRLEQDGPTETVVADYLRKLTAHSTTPVAERPDREGNGAIRLTEVLVQGRGQPEETVVLCGDCLTVTLGYRRARPVTRPVFMLGVYDALGTNLIHLNTHSAPELTQHLPDTGRLTCRIPDLPLPPGTYRLNLAVMEGPAMLDRVEAAAEFKVEPGDFFGTGRLAGCEAGKVLVRHDWAPA